MSTEPEEALPAEPSPAAPHPARWGRRLLLWGGGFLLVLYYNTALIGMALHTFIPFVALTVIGLVLGLLFARHARLACYWAFFLILIAAVVRRAATHDEPLGAVIFGGALSMYPIWAVWLGWLGRLGVYLGALRLGARVAHKFMGDPA